MSLPATPRAWAARLTQVLNLVVSGSERFPVNVSEIAKGYSREVYPRDPILEVAGESLRGFEGALLPIRGQRNGWGVLYNSDITSPGRVRFTLAHELGHYFAHRIANPAGIRCAVDDVLASKRLMEREADQFAADLLMPFDDFRKQVGARDLADLEVLSACAERYGVSLIAVLLRWLVYTERRAIVVVSRDGYLLWARSSEAAFKSGAFLKTSGTPVEVPPLSLAGSGSPGSVSRLGAVLSAGVWLPEEVKEMAVFSEQYDFAISLLLLGDAPEWPGFRDVSDCKAETKVSASAGEMRWR